MILKSIKPKLREEIAEAIAHLSKHIKKAEQSDRRSTKLQEDYDALGDELETLNGKAFLSDAESLRLSAVIARRASLTTHIQNDEAQMNPARAEMMAAYNDCNDVLGKLASLAADQVKAELVPLLSKYYLPENANAVASQSDLVQGLLMQCMRARYAMPSTLAAAVAVAKGVLAVLNDIAEGRDFFQFQPAAPVVG